MTNSMPDTDPLKRDQPVDIGKTPDLGPGEAGHPPPSPDKKGFPHTGDKHRPRIDRQGDNTTQTPQEQNRSQERDR